MTCSVISNVNLSALAKSAFSTETSSATLAVPPTHPDEHSLDFLLSQSQVENASKENNVHENASDKSQIMTSAEASLRNKRKRKKGQEKGHDATKRNDKLSALSNDASENSQIMTSVEVVSRNKRKRKRKKRQEKGHDATKSNDNLSAALKDAFSTETSTAALAVPPTHPDEHSLDSVLRQSQVVNALNERGVLENALDKSQIMPSVEVSSRNKRKRKKKKKIVKRRKKKKKRHDYIETNVNLFGVPKDNTSLETSTPILDLPSFSSGQYPKGPVMRLSQEADEEEAQNMIGKAIYGSTAVANEEVSSRKKKRKRRRRKPRCNNIECDVNHHKVPKDTFLPETCTLTLDMPSQYPALDLVMSQCQEENQGKESNMVEKATDEYPAMARAEVKLRKKNRGRGRRRRRRRRRHDFFQINVNLSGVSKGDLSHLASVSKHEHDRALSSYSKKKLLVLDLNGLLADFVNGSREGYKPDGMIRAKAVFKRPFCDDFLQFCFEKFHVGIWSSRIRQNVDAAIKLLVGVSASKLLFAWDQSHCTKTKFQTIEDKDKPLMMKELRKLWEKSTCDLPWEKGEFNETNTLLLDDSPYKSIRNPMYTAIFPYPYRYSDTNDKSLGPGGELRVYLERLATADNVQEYVAWHPFGQTPITESSPHWDFYCKVRDQSSVSYRDRPLLVYSRKKSS